MARGRPKKSHVEDYSYADGAAHWYEGNHFMTLIDNAGETPVELEVQSCLTFKEASYFYAGNRTFEDLAAEASKYGLEGIDWNEEGKWV